MADGLIGATALVHSMTVVTRNVDDLTATGARVLKSLGGCVITPNHPHHGSPSARFAFR
jgi:hypothetical protein